MASEQFSLCWDNFHKNMSTGMNSLLENEDLVDVTLAVEGKYLKAHKMVLSVCSPYFRELFKVNPCKHPIVFMKDVSYVAMSDLLQFMYQGEVQVSQENLSTFIKTAEALQIKGLTGDGNGSAECDNEPEELKSVDVVEPPKLTPASRPRKTHPAPTPPAKRPRLNAPEASPTSAITKTEPSVSSTPTNDQLIQFKMEPYDQSQASITVPDDGVDETFADDPLDDTNADEGNEDYSMMEGGDDEPQAGTSTDGAAGEGQEFFKIQPDIEDPQPKKRINRMRFVVDGFVYHNNVIAGTPPLRYLGCAEHKKSGCRGRATIPVGGTLSMLKMTQPHNHPPDVNAEEKDAFIKELKNAVRSNSMEKATLKKVYETVAEVYPKAAEEIPFKSISSSLHRWRKNTTL
ncbi:protein tramtrack, beta isoform isoform X1 [Tribolium castaneum]|uniref:protein tramtrack, beta isoform isoform X1 n=1 Tax=Tribolium castaneum TaxID=7070 RepID=UPI00046C1FF2|nr:PREDICTED: protein tramtrack, beta isoform isoform X1 [Tribolium castaneum]|eukprot:XP_008198840.1 PREDICTED: protein tramtrack, beta isoform isoform X1 [Tribolium castaneum]